MDAKPTFGQRLKAWRNSKKITQEGLAAQTGMHRMAIANMEVGHRGKSPSFDSVQKLSAALGITADELTGSMPEAPNEGKPKKKAKKKPG
jgi:transcriptional regulator with XRE-family HTH domain